MSRGAEIRNILVMMSKMMSKEQIIEKLGEDIDMYREAKLLNKSEEDITQTEHHIMFSAQLYLLHHTTGDADDVIEQMDAVKARMDLFNPPNLS